MKRIFATLFVAMMALSLSSTGLAAPTVILESGGTGDISFVKPEHWTVLFHANNMPQTQGVGEQTERRYVRDGEALGEDVPNLEIFGAPNASSGYYYSFMEWNTRRDGSGEGFTHSEISTMPIILHMKLFAQWVLVQEKTPPVVTPTPIPTPESPQTPTPPLQSPTPLTPAPSPIQHPPTPPPPTPAPQKSTPPPQPPPHLTRLVPTPSPLLQQPPATPPSVPVPQPLPPPPPFDPTPPAELNVTTPPITPILARVETPAGFESDVTEDVAPENEDETDEADEEELESNLLPTDDMDDSDDSGVIIDITEGNTPLFAGIPLFSTGGAYIWALLNLILTALNVIILILALTKRIFAEKRKYQKEQEIAAAQGYDSQITEKESIRNEKSRKNLWLFVGGAATILGIVLFIIFQDITAYMVWVDFWTIMHALLFAVGIVSTIMATRGDKDRDDSGDLTACTLERNQI